MELIDLYVNPKRLGGGFSIIEAFHNGKPGVTLKYGDVAVAAGEDFCVNSYEEMVTLIKRYSTDTKFYDKMSAKAKERARVMTDSKNALEDIVNKIEISHLFFKIYTYCHIETHSRNTFGVLAMSGASALLT